MGVLRPRDVPSAHATRMRATRPRSSSPSSSSDESTGGARTEKELPPSSATRGMGTRRTPEYDPSVGKGKARKTLRKAAVLSEDWGIGNLAALPELISTAGSGVIDAFLEGKTRELRSVEQSVVWPSGAHPAEIAGKAWKMGTRT